MESAKAPNSKLARLARIKRVAWRTWVVLSITWVLIEIVMLLLNLPFRSGDEKVVAVVVQLYAP